MSSDIPNRNPDGTFKKGFTANRNGPPPKSKRKRPATAYDILSDETFDPVATDLPPGILPAYEPAYRTFVAALKKDSKRARRSILKHIQRRDDERNLQAKLAEPIPEVRRLIEPRDPTNVDEALLILGIAEEDAEMTQPRDRRRRLNLQPWAVQAALGRRHGGRRLSEYDIADINRVTTESNKLRWPRGYKSLVKKVR